MPDFLVNSNSYHLGIKQDGEPLGDVALPPWAQVIRFLFSSTKNFSKASGTSLLLISLKVGFVLMGAVTM
jgi:hypothetical protein